MNRNQGKDDPIRTAGILRAARAAAAALTVLLLLGPLSGCRDPKADPAAEQTETAPASGPAVTEEIPAETKPTEASAPEDSQENLKQIRYADSAENLPAGHYADTNEDLP